MYNNPMVTRCHGNVLRLYPLPRKSTSDTTPLFRLSGVTSQYDSARRDVFYSLFVKFDAHIRLFLISAFEGYM
jgi:hypothetical protein